MRHRHITLAVLMTCLMSGLSWAVTPTQITVQGRLTDAGGVPIPGISSFEFRIVDSEFGGLQIWPAAGFESQNILSDSEGLWTASIGKDTSLSDAVFSGTERWLQISAGGTTLPRVRLATGPYAFRVATLDGATGGTIVSKVSIGATNAIPGDNAFAAGTSNLASGTGASVTGGNSNSATGNYSVIGGGSFNEANATRAVVAGGDRNKANGDYSFVGGGSYNTASGDHSVVVGGGSTSPADLNTAAAIQSFVGGGSRNYVNDTAAVVVGGIDNRVTRMQSAIVAGKGNRIAGGRGNSFIGAGVDNKIDDEFAGWSGIVAGDSNFIGVNHAFIGAGRSNQCGGSYSAVVAGQNNFAGGLSSAVVGGQNNVAGGTWGAILGGFGDTTALAYATVLGGTGNTAKGRYSLSGGRRAKAINHGTFVWADSTNEDFYSTAANQFLIRASGGVGLGTNIPHKQLHILDDSSGGLAYALKLSNEAPVVDFPATGILFQVDAGPRRGKGGLIYERTQTWNRGSFHFLQNPTADSMNAGLANKVFTIQNDGKVGIGQPSPSNILTVVQGSATDPIADSWTQHSSRRWKKNITPIDGALEKVRELQGVYYDEKSTDLRNIGLIAEDVGKVIPEVVAYEANGVDAKSVDYARLVAVLIEGMKEQQRQIDELRAILNRTSE